MQEPTKKLHIKKDKENPIKEVISADDFFNDSSNERPKGAIALSGYRYRENLTQKQLGEMIEVSQPNISKMEKGKRSIGKNIAKRLAKVLNTDYRLFL